MAKSKNNPTIQNRHIYNRASYLYQAASFLASCAQQHTKAAQQHGTPPEDANGTPSLRHSAFVSSDEERKATMNLSRQVISDMRSVSLKAQIRQSQDIKRTICKFCDTLQVEGKTCSSTVENRSKGAKKPWADVLVIRCTTCENSKKYPVSASRQKRKPLRTSEPLSKEQSPGRDSTDPSGLGT